MTNLKDVVVCKEFNSYFLIKQDGSLYFGGESFGFNSTILKEILEVPKIKDLSCSTHVLARTDKNDLLVFGENNYGQLGLGNETLPFIKTPTINPFITNVSLLSAGLYFSIILQQNGNLYGFGLNNVCLKSLTFSLIN